MNRKTRRNAACNARRRTARATNRNSEIRIPNSEIRNPASRRGSVLVVVIGMLLLLMLVGFTFFTFSGQEQSSAEYYADSAKVFTASSDANALFDWGLEQLIIGPHDYNTQSVLWPGKHSLVPNMLGWFTYNHGVAAASGNAPAPPNAFNDYPTVPLDRHPYNDGWGINVIAGPQGQPWIDQNFNGVRDFAENPSINNNYFLTVNWSPAATGPAGLVNVNSRQGIFNAGLPPIGVGYTYPDINNVFLAHIGMEPQSAMGTNPIPVIIPSFHRPQYLRDYNTGLPLANWFNQQGANTTAALVMRPHPDHICVADPASRKRFLSAPAVVLGSNPLRYVQPFPFASDGNGNNLFGEQGVWSNSPPNNVDYDVDNDGDGKLEGIWMDLNFPPSVLPDGRISVPLFSYTVVEADSLLNLNQTGNLSGFASLATGLNHPFGNGQAISRSNLGVSSTEVNPFWSLVADPQNSLATFFTDPFSALQQYRGFFGYNNPATFSVSRIEAANMDQLFLFWGKPQYDVTVNGASEVFTLSDVTVGLWGEASNGSIAPNSLFAGLSTGQPGQSPPTTPGLFPRPGWSAYDDDGDQYAGTTDLGDMSIYHWFLPQSFPNVQNFPAPPGNPLYPFAGVPPFAQPLDYTGGGQWLMTPVLGPNNGMVPMMAAPFPATNPPSAARFLQYYGYQSQMGYNALALYSTSGGSPNIYQGVMGGNYLSQQTYTEFGISGLVDEGDEVVADRRYPQAGDQIFTPDETAAMQLSASDFLTVGGQSRVRQLASLNFDLNQYAAAIRQHFTTESWDRRQHGFSIDHRLANGRYFEYGSNNPANNLLSNNNNWDGTGNAQQFPPRVLTNLPTNPFPSLDGQIPANADSAWASQPAVEPIRMELAALIGATQSNSLFTNFNTTTGQNAFNTPAYDGQTSRIGMSPWQQQARLNINRLLTVANPSNAFGTQYAASNPLVYRELTPHPTLAQWQAIGNPTAAVDITIGQTAGTPRSFATDSQSFASNPALQEYWARRDRQQMARDIYVLLYMFGGGAETDANGNPLNYAFVQNSASGTTPPIIRPVYSNWQLAEMAQFAVNYVDALDRDDTITVFEYDMNLADGWNLDDDPFTSSATTPADPIVSQDRGVAYGVEAQQLAFSEALVIVAQQVKSYLTPYTPKDHPATLLDDSKTDRSFTYLELYNVSASPVPLNNLNWQIALLSPLSTAPSTQPMISPANTAVNPAPTVPTAATLLTLNDNVNMSVSPGQPYTIGSRTYFAGSDDISPTVPYPSTFVVDPQWAGANPDPNLQTPSISQIAPAYNALIPPPQVLNLDLVKQALQPPPVAPTANQPFMLTDGGTGLTYNNVPVLAGESSIGNFVNFGPTANTGSFGSGPTYTTTFILRRRLNLNRPAPQIQPGISNPSSADEADNPWIEVDRISYVNQYLPLTGGPVTAFPSGAPTMGTFFNLQDPANPAISGNVAGGDIQPKLQRLVTRERRQPLDGYDSALAGAGYPAPPASPTLPPNFNNLYVSHLSVYPNLTALSFRPNTLGTTNYQTTAANPTIGTSLQGAFSLWQPHFDRDFASVGELLSIPLYTPYTLTQSLAPQDTTAYQTNQNTNTMAAEVPLSPIAGAPYMPFVAQAKILRPQHPQNVGQTLPAAPYPAGSTYYYDNAWHRVFELLEVQTRQNMVVENYLQSNFPWLAPQAEQRVAAKINLNALRYPENLYSLLDDPNTFQIGGYNNPFNLNPLTQLPFGDGSYNDMRESGARNWWFELIKARDVADYQATATYGNLGPVNPIPIYLPGAPGARPIRSFSSVERNPNNYGVSSAPPMPNSLYDTLLRPLPLDDLAVNGSATLLERGLFEARTKADVGMGVGQNTVDYYTRQRLLSKIAGNTTNRSNVFLVWMTVGFFEGFQPDPVNNPGVVQVGAEMTDQQRRRGFFIVDRSLLEDAWVPPQLDSNNNLIPTTGIYDFRKFVQYRKTIQ